MEQELNPKKHLATVSILLKDRKDQAPLVNEILTNHGHLIIARLGVNVQRYCVKHCTAIITVVVEGTAREISAFTKELDELYGIVAKDNILTN